MKSRLHTESQFLISAHHSNRNDVSGSDEERGIQHIFRLSYSLPADLQENVAGFDSGTGGWGVFHYLLHFCNRTFHWLPRHGDIDPDPAMSCFSETHEIAPNFLGCLDWHSGTRWGVLETADHDANDLTFHVQKRRTGFPTLCRQVNAQMRCREITT